MKERQQDIEHGHHLSLVIEQPAQLDPHAPAPFVPPFLPNLQLAASLSEASSKFKCRQVGRGVGSGLPSR